MKRTVIICTILLFSVGCMSKSFDYKYISLEQLEGIEIVSHGKSELSRLKSDDDMPTRYKLSRKNYILIFELDKKNHWPSILVSSKSLSGVGLVIEAITVGDCGGFDDWGVQYKVDNLQALRYVWSPAFRRNCKMSGNEDYPSQQVISFVVKDQEGKVFGEERLPFVLIKNGTYYEKDSL